MRERTPFIKTGVGCVVFRGPEVLLIRRGKPPFEGDWSIPGGGVEFGEALKDAAVREVLEETGCAAEIVSILEAYESLPQDHGDEAAHYIMIDYVARWVSGEPVAGDDAAEAAFFPFDAALERVYWDTTRTAIRDALALYERLGAAPKTG